jgi:hypothetical protein
MNIEHRTSNTEWCILSILKKDWTKRSYPLKFCGSLVLKSIKRSVINIGRSMFDVRRSMFNLFTVPVRRNFICSFIWGFGFPLLRSSRLTPDTWFSNPGDKEWMTAIYQRPWLTTRWLWNWRKSLNLLQLHLFQASKPAGFFDFFIWFSADMVYINCNPLVNKFNHAGN